MATFPSTHVSIGFYNPTTGLFNVFSPFFTFTTDAVAQDVDGDDVYELGDQINVTIFTDFGPLPVTVTYTGPYGRWGWVAW